MKKKDKNGFTLVEMVTVLAILGVFIGFFYTLFFLNWGACEQFIARADFGQDMDTIIDQFAQDGRNSTAGKDSVSPQQVVFNDSNGKVISTYTMTNAGVFTIATGGNPPVVITQDLDPANSNFAWDPPNIPGSAITITLTMTNQVLSQTIKLSSETEIYPRN